MSEKLKCKYSIIWVFSRLLRFDTLEVYIDVAVKLVLKLTLVKGSDVASHFDELRFDKADLILFH